MRELYYRNSATQRIQMSFEERSKEYLTAARRIFEVNLSLIKCMVKIMNRNEMTEKRL